MDVRFLSNTMSHSLTAGIAEMGSAFALRRFIWNYSTLPTSLEQYVDSMREFAVLLDLLFVLLFHRWKGGATERPGSESPPVLLETALLRRQAFFSKALGERGDVHYSRIKVNSKIGFESANTMDELKYLLEGISHEIMNKGMQGRISKAIREWRGGCVSFSDQFWPYLPPPPPKRGTLQPTWRIQ